MAADELLLLSYGLDLSGLRTVAVQAKAALKDINEIGGFTVEFVGFEILDRMFSQFPEEIKAGVKVSGPASNYALVWEWGRVDITPGPKTQWSVNPDGQEAVLTIQAPFGWIRVNREQYLEFLRDEWSSIDLTSKSQTTWIQALHDMLWNASSRCASLMEDTATVDTGQLRSGIIAVNEPDPILEEGTENDYGSTSLELGSNWL